MNNGTVRGTFYQKDNLAAVQYTLCFGICQTYECSFMGNQHDVKNAIKHDDVLCQDVTAMISTQCV